MVIDRINQEINLQIGDRFIVLYGATTSDSFCSEDLILQDIEQVLYQYLKDQNYQRIAFYSGNRKLYFLDCESRDRSLLRPLTSSPTNTNDEIKVTPGPLGRKKTIFRQKNQSNFRRIYNCNNLVYSIGFTTSFKNAGSGCTSAVAIIYGRHYPTVSNYIC
ncbi:hypothetical protein QQ056_03665 [Oscillatoria laete-virens NRMC-F 0139]|nr:hypothetical protein [Oscillatoria laete-virens]MDL5052659.1 hypothetical protein [Oscillatoria laete-virens NRMC-F 0139]